MHRAVLAVLMVLALSVAGCLADGGSDDGASPSDVDDPDAGSADGDDPGENATISRPNATLEDPPEWRVGDWWTTTVTDAFSGETHTTTRVVAAREGSTYHVGLAADDFSDAAVVAGWPPVGEVQARDLSFQLHGERFQPVAFPLEEGTSWSTTYEGREGYEAEVVSVAGTTAEVGMTRTAQSPFGSVETTMNLTYDARHRAVTEATDDLGRTYEVTDRGEAYEGDVVVPLGRAQHLEGRVIGVFDGLAVTPNFAPPTGSVRVSQPAASAMLLAGSAPLAGGSPPGVYQEVAQPPGGDAFQLDSTGTEGLSVTHVHAEEASGTWEFQHVAGGYGAAATEIVAYDPLTVTLDGTEALPEE